MQTLPKLFISLYLVQFCTLLVSIFIFFWIVDSSEALNQKTDRKIDIFPNFDLILVRIRKNHQRPRMDAVKAKWKKNIFLKAWERCHSVDSGRKKSTMQKSKSWSSTATPINEEDDHDDDNRRRRRRKTKWQVAPGGCFSVYVGPEKQRFVIKAEYANHPLFKMLLEDAEMEYGFASEGPLLLPCDVGLFYKVLAEMDSRDEISTTTPTCSSLNILCSPSRGSCCRRSINNGYGAYSLLSPSRMLKLNHHQSCTRSSV